MVIRRKLRKFILAKNIFGVRLFNIIVEKALVPATGLIKPVILILRKMNLHSSLRLSPPITEMFQFDGHLHEQTDGAEMCLCAT